MARCQLPQPPAEATTRVPVWIERFFPCMQKISTLAPSDKAFMIGRSESTNASVWRYLVNRVALWATFWTPAGGSSKTCGRRWRSYVADFPSRHSTMMSIGTKPRTTPSADSRPPT